MRSSVILDTASGQALIGGTVMAVSQAGPGGELQIGGSSGPILRPLRFGERTRVVVSAASSPSALDSLCRGILHAATVQEGTGDRTVQEVLALALAGADQEAPSFAASALRVARAAGWEFNQLYEAEAAEVDRLAIYLGGPTPDSGWNRIVFASSADTLEGVRRELGEQLLKRADPFAGDVEAESSATAPMGDSAVYASTVGGHQAGPAGLLEADGLTSGQELVPRQPPDDPLAVGGTRQRYIRVRAPAVAYGPGAGAQPVSSPSSRPDAVSLPAVRWSLSPQRDGPRTDRPIDPGMAVSTSEVPVETLPAEDVELRQQPLQLIRSESGAAPETKALMIPLHSPALVKAAHVSASAAVELPESVMTLQGLRPSSGDWLEVADALAELLDHEADMRGIER
jgi:hypothetical protein